MLAASDTAIREWIVGVGPVIAAVVALYLGVWRERWRRPRLELHLDKSSDQDLVTRTADHSAPRQRPNGAQVAAWTGTSDSTVRRRFISTVDAILDALGGELAETAAAQRVPLCLIRGDRPRR